MDKQDRKNGPSTILRRKAWAVDETAAVDQKYAMYCVPMIYTDWRKFHVAMSNGNLVLNHDYSDSKEWEKEVDRLLATHTSRVWVSVADVVFVYDPLTNGVDTGLLAQNCSWCVATRDFPVSTGTISSRCICAVGPYIGLPELSMEGPPARTGYRNTALVRRQIAISVMQNTDLASGLNAWSARSQARLGDVRPRALAYARNSQTVSFLLSPTRKTLHG